MREVRKNGRPVGDREDPVKDYEREQEQERKEDDAELEDLDSVYVDDTWDRLDLDELLGWEDWRDQGDGSGDHTSEGDEADRFGSGDPDNRAGTIPDPRDR